MVIRMHERIRAGCDCDCEWECDCERESRASADVKSHASENVIANANPRAFLNASGSVDREPPPNLLILYDSYAEVLYFPVYLSFYR